MGQVCAKHNEFFEYACRWCEPSPFIEGPSAAAAPPPVPATAAHPMFASYAVVSAILKENYCDIRDLHVPPATHCSRCGWKALP